MISIHYLIQVSINQFKKKILELNISKEKFHEDFLGKIYSDNSIIVANILKNGEMKIYAFEINIYIFNFFDTLITSYELGIEKVIEKCENFINENSRMRMK